MAVALKHSGLGLSIHGHVLVVPLGPVSPEEPKAAGIMLPHSSQSPPNFPKTLAGCCYLNSITFSNHRASLFVPHLLVTRAPLLEAPQIPKHRVWKCQWAYL